MRHALTTAFAALLGLTLLSPTSAGAAGETCQGQPATLVGTPGQALVGTEGADVIVTNGALRLNALGGDDLICVTGPSTGGSDDSRTLTLEAGSGNDAVEAVTAGWGTSGALGLGADTYTGTSAAQHFIRGGEFLPLNSDTETDTIRISAGTAEVYVGTAGQPNGDVVEIEDGFVQTTGLMTPTARLRGGPGSTLRISTSTGDASIDASRGTAVTRTSDLVFSGFPELAFYSASFDGTLTYTGTDGDDRLSVDAPGAYVRHIDMRGGDDTYVTDTIGGPGSRFDARAGRDHLVLATSTVRSLTADLGADRFVVRDGRKKLTRTYRRFEDVTLAARTVDVDGTRTGERIVVAACRAEISAGAGRDVVGLRAGLTYPFGGPACSSRRAFVDGGRGDDVISGSRGRDVLVGGPGRDRVDGDEGRDTCQGERLRRCEVRR